MTWDQMKRQAEILTLPELERHASVSINNHHRCEQCFTCACAAVARERQARIQRRTRGVHEFVGETIDMPCRVCRERYAEGNHYPRSVDP